MITIQHKNQKENKAFRRRFRSKKKMFSMADAKTWHYQRHQIDGKRERERMTFSIEEEIAS